jgi:Fe-S-cluster-containing hydrogenase component 2
MGLLEDGYFSDDELTKLPGVPSKERLAQGPVAIIECGQQIPCDPCVDACHKQAISLGDKIIGMPTLDAKKCGGCGLCIADCPGQAIFVVDATYSETEGTVQMPYEYVPLPQKGDVVDGLSRSGQKLCEATVLKVLDPKGFDRTPVITVVVPKEQVMDVRSLKLRT